MIKDEEFENPYGLPGPTKEEIRVLTLSKAMVERGNTVADIGCGTGGISVQAAGEVGEEGRVFAVDLNKRAVETTRTNAKKFGMESIIEVLHGEGFEILQSLPHLDATIVGGSGGHLREIIEASYEKLRDKGHMVVNCITMETCSGAFDALKEVFGNVDVTLVMIANGKDLDFSTIMISRNPVMIMRSIKAGIKGEK